MTDQPIETGPDAKFVNAICEVQREGFAFVPLIGAGLSAPSGNPIASDLGNYLIRCICRALGIDHPGAWSITNQNGDFDLSKVYRWLPGRDHWPSFGDPQIYDRDTEDWHQRLLDFFGGLKSAIRASKKPEREILEREIKVYQEAVGACADWRSALLFLSRLTIAPPQPGQEPSPDNAEELRHLGPPNRDIVDTFVLAVMMGRPPTLGHRMLAALAGPLRIDITLTTNFDDLLEKAFIEANQEPTVFDVHIDSGLPPYSDVCNYLSVVKLHGGRFGMRADYSLDTYPTEADLRHFCSYLAGIAINEKTWDSLRAPKEPLSAKRHLLVMGVGANDERINLMIQRASQCLKGLHIFWLTYQRDEREKLVPLFGRFGISDVRAYDISLDETVVSASKVPKKSQKVYPKNVAHILCHRFPGLLLLQAYQRLTGSVPSTHNVFASAPRVPVPPEWTTLKRPNDDEKKHIAKLNRLIEECAATAPELSIAGVRRQERTRCVVVTGSSDGVGGMTIAAGAFEKQLDRGRQAIWIDLDEIGSVADLFETLLHTVARRAGTHDWLPVSLNSPLFPIDSPHRWDVDQVQVHELARLTNSPNRKWVIFLNARSGAGWNLKSDFSGDAATGSVRCLNGWLDVSLSDGTQAPSATPVTTAPPWPGVEFDPTANGTLLLQLLKRIGGQECPNVSLVLACFNGPFTEVELPTLKPRPFRYLLPTPSPNADKDELLQIIDGWLDSDKDGRLSKERFQFLWSLVLVNRTRHTSLMWLWPFQETFDNDGKTVPLHERMETANEYLTDLEKAGVLRRKVGGFVWLMCRKRDRVRVHLRQRASRSNSGLPREAKIHNGLAEWYHRLFRSTGDPAAVFESAYHRTLQAAHCLESFNDFDSERPSDDSPPAQAESLEAGDDTSSASGTSLLENNRLAEARLALGDIAAAFARGRQAMLSVGFSKGLCRRLEHFRGLIDHRIVAKLAATRKNAGKNQAILKQVKTIEWICQGLLETSFLLNRDIALEVGENAIAFRRHFAFRALRCAIVTNTTANGDSTMLEGVLDIASRDVESFLSVQEQKRRDTKEERAKRLGKLENEGLCDWMRSTQELASLGIAIRGYRFVKKQLKEKLLENENVEFPHDLLEQKHSVHVNHEPLDTFAERISHYNDVFDLKPVEQVVNGLRRYQQLEVQRGLLLTTWAERKKRMKTQDGNAETEEGQKAFRTAVRTYEAAAHLIRFIASGRDRTQSGETLLAETDGTLDRIRHRLITNHAWALAFERDFGGAHARLNDAEASLNVIGMPNDTLDRGIIELFRAEVLTQESLYTNALTQKEGHKSNKADPTEFGRFGSIRRKMLAMTLKLPHEVIKPEWKEMDSVWKGILGLHDSRNGTKGDLDLEKQLRTSSSILIDASQTLVRAERAMKRFRKNVWWTTWFFELQMKVIELQVFMCLVERLYAASSTEAMPSKRPVSGPLAHIGPESAGFAVPTLAERLIDNCERMARVDLFRVARVLESFANIVFATLLWNNCDSSGQSKLVKDFVDARIDQLCQRMMNAREKLEERLKHRSDIDKKIEATKLDPDVAEYVKFVLNHCKHVAKWTQFTAVDRDTKEFGKRATEEKQSPNSER